MRPWSGYLGWLRSSPLCALIGWTRGVWSELGLLAVLAQNHHVALCSI